MKPFFDGSESLLGGLQEVVDLGCRKMLTVASVVWIGDCVKLDGSRKILSVLTFVELSFKLVEVAMFQSNIEANQLLSRSSRNSMETVRNSMSLFQRIPSI